MISKKKKAASTVAASVLAAAAFTLTVPGTSFAINEVKCDPNENYVKIWSHPSNGAQSVNCYANGGKQSLRRVVHRQGPDGQQHVRLPRQQR